MCSRRPAGPRRGQTASQLLRSGRPEDLGRAVQVNERTPARCYGGERLQDGSGLCVLQVCPRLGPAVLRRRQRRPERLWAPELDRRHQHTRILTERRLVPSILSLQRSGYGWRTSGQSRATMLNLKLNVSQKVQQWLGLMEKQDHFPTPGCSSSTMNSFLILLPVTSRVSSVFPNRSRSFQVCDHGHLLLLRSARCRQLLPGQWTRDRNFQDGF